MSHFKTENGSNEQVSKFFQEAYGQRFRSINFEDSNAFIDVTNDSGFIWFPAVDSWIVKSIQDNGSFTTIHYVNGEEEAD